MALIDITGNRYNKLVAVKFVEIRDSNAYWEFVCDCGEVVIRAAHSVKRGGQKSCGCHRKETTSAMRLKHGETGTRLYRIWSAMKRRCELPSCQAYVDYGMRGIQVCREWKDYEPFRDWALANGYGDDVTIDREDNDGNYEPDNCRWVDRKVQANNRRSSRLIEWEGETYTLQELADAYDLHPSTLSNRLDTGWDLEDALTKKRWEPRA